MSLYEYTGATPKEKKHHEVGNFQFDVPYAYNGILIKIGKINVVQRKRD